MIGPGCYWCLFRSQSIRAPRLQMAIELTGWVTGLFTLDKFVKRS